MHRRQKPPPSPCPLLVFSRVSPPPPRDGKQKITADVFFPFVEPARPRIGRGIRFVVTACACARVIGVDESILLTREWIAQRGQASVEARNDDDDDDPSKMKEVEEGRRAARLSFLMSIGSDSLLNAAMISRSGRGRTRVSSLVHEIAIRYAVMLVGFSPPPTRRACDTRVVLRQKFARGI